MPRVSEEACAFLGCEHGLRDVPVIQNYCGYVYDDGDDVGGGGGSGDSGGASRWRHEFLVGPGRNVGGSLVAELNQAAAAAGRPNLTFIDVRAAK
jgi:hypothetical protein